MSPTLDRDEIAVRLACALIARDGYDDEGAPRDAVTLADALLRSLAPTPAPVAPPAPTPAPEAKRPEWVRVTKDIEFDDLGKGDWFARGYEVLHAKWWDSDGNPVVVTPRGHFGSLKPGEWEPAPCPPPVAGRGEALPEDVRDFLLDVEYAAKWANQPQGPTVEYVKGRLKELAALAHDILSRPVRP